MQTKSTKKKEDVAILLCTYNGEKYIKDQLNSYFSQKHKSWKLYISDDGSSDSTIIIAQKIFKEKNDDRLVIVNGPRKGATANFLSLLCSDTVNGHKYYCFSDQDDIWLEDKLEVAIKELNTKVDNKPILFCSTTTLINESGEVISGNPKIWRNQNFPNALGHIIATGNTMVFNNSARNVLLEAGDKINPAGHDWWTYIAISAVGGEVIFKKKPGLRYRMHENNVAGISIGFHQRAQKFFEIIKSNEIKLNNSKNLSALKKIENRLTPEAKKTINLLEKSRKSIFPLNLYYLIKSKIKRRTSISQIAYFIAALQNKL